ncbi:MAG: Rpp14/Pop5 family protein [Candidatus Bathyarchaeota archaeon]|nr:Rpp14/Pop5 family protein [Candidatus Bathyarchaeota archaeon]
MKRSKRRYLALQIDFDGAPTPKEFIDAVWNAVTRLYGEYGASLTSLTLIAYNAENKSAVIRVALATLGMVKAALASITVIGNKEATVHVVAVSGTIKSLNKQLK